MKYKNKKIIIIFFLILLSGNLFSQQRQQITGLIWERMRFDNKLYFITGFLQGLEKGEQIMDIEIKAREKNEFAFTKPFYVHQTQKKIRLYFPDDQNLTLNQLIELVDIFYTDEYNKKIKFQLALRIILARQKGEIDKADLWLQEARKRVKAGD